MVLYNHSKGVDEVNRAQRRFDFGKPMDTYKNKNPEQIQPESKIQKREIQETNREECRSVRSKRTEASNTA